MARSSQILSGEQEEVGGGAISELAVPSFGQSPGTRVQHGEKGSISPNKFCPNERNIMTFPSEKKGGGGFDEESVTVTHHNIEWQSLSWHKPNWHSS